MTDNTLPEVGSRWTIDDEPVSIFATKKRGRGFQVVVEYAVVNGEGRMKFFRLADFRKQAKPA